MRRPFLNGLFRPAPFDDCDDPHRAPSAYRGPDMARAWTWRRARQNLIWVYFFGLVFLLLSNRLKNINIRFNLIIIKFRFSRSNMEW